VRGLIGEVKKEYRILFALHLFIGVGAIFGGLAGMLNPVDPLGIPNSLLDGSPFNNFFIPSLILFVVIGLGHIFSAITARLNSKHQGYITSIFSWALMIWIVVQCLIINTVDFLHVLYFGLGLCGAVLGMRILFAEGSFPASLLAGLFSKEGR
jgi:hypothetical protein